MNLGKRTISRSILLELFSYHPSTGILTHKKNRQGVRGGARAGTKKKYGYRNVCVKRIIFREHRVIWALLKGTWPEQIDHIDGDRQNNRIENLRASCPSSNAHNHKVHRDGRPLGVYQKNGKWVARAPRKYLQRNSSDNKYLGTFSTIDEAAKAVYEYCNTA